MDVNYFLEREQIERRRARQASSAEACAAHEAMAERYRDRIERYRRAPAKPRAPADQPRLPTL